MRTISIEGFEASREANVGPAPMLQWLKISDLLVDPSYQRPIAVEGRRNVMRIARQFRWSYFAPVIVSPVEGGRFAIIDGQHRTTAAALVGIDSVPCQVVVAARDEQAAAFKAINGMITPISRMALHAAALVAREPRAVEVAEVCASAGVELLRYPVPLEQQAPGQTMAVGAIEACLRRYGRETLAAALQCVTQTRNNHRGMLSARMIKALCELLGEDPSLPTSWPVLLKAFDKIDLANVHDKSMLKAVERGSSRVSVIVDGLKSELAQRMRRLAAEC